MKKIILSLAALFSVAVVSAQSYPKQPDPSVITYIEYKKVAPVQQESVTSEDAQAETAQAEGNTPVDVKATQPATVTGNAVTENRKNNKAKKD